MNLLKKIFSLWVQTNWIKTINKEQRKLRRLEEKISRQRFVVNELYNEYLKRYPKRTHE